MNTEQKRILHWWWSWDAEKIARWLEEMAAAGWMLERTSFNMLVFHFRRDRPLRMSFSADFQSQDLPNYKEFIGSTGWTLISQSGSWFIWGREYRENEPKPEFFSDIDSLVARNNRVLLLLVAILMPQFAVFQIILKRLTDKPSPFMAGLAIIHILISGFLGYAVVRTLQENRHLKKQGEGYGS